MDARFRGHDRKKGALYDLEPGTSASCLVSLALDNDKRSIEHRQHFPDGLQ